MTVRQTGSLRANCNTDGNINTKQSPRQNTRSLAAVANPMGITIIDTNTPQRSYLTLNYSTSTISTSTSSYMDKSIGNGGITTMAFQPCFTSHQVLNNTTNGTSSYIQSSHTTQHPILLATARGNGILIWDCSGQSLSPLLGRLNALDSWSSKKRKNVAVDDTTNKEGNTREGSIREGSQMVDESGHQPTTSLDSSTATSAQDGLKSSILSPISIERQPSVLSVSSNANNNNNLLNTSSNSGGTVINNQSAMNKTSAATTSSVLMNNNNVVTSLDWKKSTSAPILLATAGASSCIWDLRTSLFSGLTSTGGSGVSSSNSGGCRPNLRFTITSQSDIYYNPSTALIHCTYSITNEYIFATLDNLGVVRVWDERKPGEFPIQSFVGCSGGGVGVASISPLKKKGGADADDVYYSRWVTWGMDDNGENENEQPSRSDDLIVKVWTESSKKIHNRTLSTTSTDADVSNRSEDTRVSGTNTDDVYNCTSRISVQGGVAARVHPSFENGILLFRDTSNPSSSLRQGDGALPSPNTAGATPEMVSAQTPPSPPPLMLDDVVQGKNTERLESSRDHQGWEAQLWCIEDEDSPVVTDADASKEAANSHGTTAQGAKKIASFRGGGAEDDALNFAPRRRVATADCDVIAVDLALDKASPKKEEELSVCVLTKAGRLTVYGVPEASELVKNDGMDTSSSRRERSDSKSNPMARSLSPAVYRQGTLDHHASQWWNKNEEEDLFGEASSRDSPKKSSMESLTSAAALDSIPKSTNDNVAEKATNVGQSISSDVSTSMEEVVVSQDAETSTNNIPIDPARAARVPCPPLCGVAFSAAGELITFNNGPVKQMWSYYQANDALSPNGPKSLSSTISFEPNDTKNSSDTNTANGDEEEGSTDQNQVIDKRTLPRTLADLVDMNLRSQTLQWGEGNDDQPDNEDDEEEDEEEDDGSSSDNSSEVALDDDSDDDDELEGSYHMVSNDPQHKREDSSDMFDEYFASSRKPLLGEENKGANEVFAGLPSLSPSVLITRKYDDILLNGQTPQLANLLKLGDEWWLSQDFSVPDIGRCQIIKKNTTDSKDTKQEPSSGDDSKAGSSMMGSLKKMFANQLSSVIAAHSNGNKQTTQVGAHLDRPDHALTNFNGCNKVDQPGVYMLDNPQTPEAASQRLLVTQELCLYNAKVCLDCGQKSKADTWSLLAQTVENILTFETDETDGWGGDEDALTTGIVEQILLWYEVQGDYQMLSSIVCVLSFGRDRRDRTAGRGGRYRLLPKFDDRRYDNYIHRYGTLLYAWGLLTVRSEISKRLAYGVNTVEEIDDTTNGSFISMVCTRCVEPISDVNGICSKCKEYVFQCSICCSAVRGAYTWCLSCNHGGHVQCHQAWFKVQNMCPSGCGCECKLITGSTTS